MIGGGIMDSELMNCQTLEVKDNKYFIKPGECGSNEAATLEELGYSFEVGM